MPQLFQLCIIVSAITCGPDQPEDLRRLLASKDKAERIQAVRNVAAKGDEAKPVIPLLLEALKSEGDQFVTIELLTALVRIDQTDGNVVRAVIGKMRCPPVRVLLCSMGLLEDEIGVPAVPFLLNDLKGIKGDEARISAHLVVVMAIYSDRPNVEISEDVVKSLSEFLFHPESEVRIGASYAFRMIGPRKGTQSILPVVTQACIKHDDRSRVNYREIYKKFGERSLPHLKLLLSHRDKEIRMFALATLGGMPLIAVPLTPEIEKATRDSDYGVQYEALLALQRMEQAKNK